MNLDFPALFGPTNTFTERTGPKNSGASGVLRSYSGRRCSGCPSSIGMKVSREESSEELSFMSSWAFWLGCRTAVNWDLVETLWDPLETLWDHLEPLWDPLEPLWDPVETHWDPAEAPGRRSGGTGITCGRVGARSGELGSPLEPVGTALDERRRAARGAVRSALPCDLARAGSAVGRAVVFLVGLVLRGFALPSTEA